MEKHNVAYNNVTKNNASMEKDWSATKTMNHVVKMSNGNVNKNVFDEMTNELFDQKCWNEKDFIDFNMSLQKIMMMQQQMLTSDDPIKLLLMPEYYNAIHDMYDKMDTINVMCVYATDNKCKYIDNEQKRKLFEKNMNDIVNIFDVYTPIFIRTVLFMEKMLDGMQESCKLPPSYFNKLKKLKKRIIGSVYMRNMYNKNPKEIAQKLREMSNIHNKNNINTNAQRKSKMFEKNSVNMVEQFEGDNVPTKRDDFVFYVVFIIVFIIVTYIVYKKLK
jgi:hypothetical protein